MADKKCCIENCNSRSTRQEDHGVTYHKFPKDTTLCDAWVTVTRHKSSSDIIEYVCSRHFCKSDFQPFKDSKYILKSDAVPSIFPWTMDDSNKTKVNQMEETKDSTELSNENPKEVFNSSKESNGAENLDAKKKFIQDHDEKIDKVKTKADEVLASDVAPATVTELPNTETEPTEVENNEVNKLVNDRENNEHETLAVASSVMDMILSESEAKIAERKHGKPPDKRKFSAGDKGNSMPLSVGSKVEAKDFGEYWHPAQIIEVDYDEMEVLVHYEDTMKKHDEWISVSSPRLRPAGARTPEGSQTPARKPSTPSVDPEPVQVKEEIKVEEKPKIAFAVGERCLARWRDNRRFIATIIAELADSKYEIMFDDGVRWTCSVVRLSKLKEPSKRESLSVETTGLPSSGSAPSPVYGPGPSSTGVLPAPLPVFNTHLFDPTRDYLGSKSERREMKRKLNIKEIFNIGQKKKKVETPVKRSKPKEKAKVVKEEKPKVVKKPVKLEEHVKVKKDIPDAIASIIGMAPKETDLKKVKEEVDTEVKKEDVDSKAAVAEICDSASKEALKSPKPEHVKIEEDIVMEETVKLENFEKPDDNKHEEVIDRIKEVITKLEDGLSKAEVKLERMDLKPLLKEEVKAEEVTETQPVLSRHKDKKKKNLSKMKKVKKVRLLQEKKVKKQVEQVQSELEEMKKKFEEMKKQMSEEIAKKPTEMPESFLLPGEWCCKWVNGQPVGTVSEIEQENKVDANNKPVLPRRSVQVEDKRLPPGWTKHMVRRSFGNSAGKWDVVLMSPDNRRLHTKTDMKHYLESIPDESLISYESALMDFGIHLKLSRRMGWYTTTPDGTQEGPVSTLPAGTLSCTSPLVKKKKLSLKKSRKDGKKLRVKLKMPKEFQLNNRHPAINGSSGASAEVPPADAPPENLPLEDGFVYVGSLKVQIIENLLRCPAEGCYKNFRNNTLLKMHIKHYHRELRKMLGVTPKVVDLAYARTRPTQVEMRRLKLEAQRKTIKVKLPKMAKRVSEPKPEIHESIPEPQVELAPTKPETVEKIPRSLDSPQLRIALTNKPIKRPKVLLPVRRPEPPEPFMEEVNEDDIEVEEECTIRPIVEVPNMEALDFETAISTHTVTKPIDVKGEKKKTFASIAKKTASDDEEWYGANSDVETRSSYPRSGTPDSKMDQKLVSSESNEEQKEQNYMYTETGERIKIVHMKREEIINCHCGFREEDGLMVQCELCLCWQHALCHNIQKESEVPEKYTCSICLNPRRGRRSQRFLHDQDRLYEGLLPGAKPCECLRRSHELSGNLHRIEDALHALRVKYYVATKKDHPKLYLWAKDWEAAELTMTQEKLNSDYSDLSVMISNLGKENRPLREDIPLRVRTPSSEQSDADRFSQKDSQLGSQALLSGLLSSPGGASLELPITTTELERLAKTVQAEQEQVIAPVPEAPIENSACRERLLRHIQRCQALIDARLDSIEAQVAELESQDPSFEDDETADYFPRTKQTIQMLMRDLDTMEELGVIT